MKLPNRTERAFWRKLGASIQVERKRHRMSQNELAGHVGRTRVWVSNAERGKSRFSVHALIEIGKALRVDPWRLAA